MAARAIGTAGVTDDRLFASVFHEGLDICRDRWRIYALLALICAAAGVAGVDEPLRFTSSLAFRSLMVSALLAIFFIFPSALRRLEPNFTMNRRRAIVMVVMLLSIGLVSEVGYIALIVPGIVVGVLLSQALLSAMLSGAGRAEDQDVFGTLVDGFTQSFALTKSHFATTLAVIGASLAIVLVPFLIGLITLVVLEVLQPRTLGLTAPMLLLTFVYFEGVRYALIVRWYARLHGFARTANPHDLGVVRGM